jgi:hypothetical protein
MAYETIMCCQVNPGRMGLIGAPTFPMLRDATQRSLFEALDNEGINYRFNPGPNMLTFPHGRRFGGAQVIFRSLDHFERVRGTNLAWFGIDELTYCKPEAWSRLEGRLRDPFARQRIGFGCWTPKGFDWVYEKFIRPDRDHPNAYAAVLASPGENTHLPDDFYTDLGKSYDKKFFEQEVLGQYLNVFSGQAYYAYDPAANVRKLDFDPSLPVLWSLDFNVEPMSSVIAQRKPMPAREDDFIHVLDELVIHQSNTAAACEAFRERMEKWAELKRNRGQIMDVIVYGDASGNGRRTSAENTDYQIIKLFFRRFGHLFNVQYKVGSANPAVRDRVNAVNARLCNSKGERRLFHDPRCKELAKDFNQVVYLSDSHGNTVPELDKSDKARSHLGDAMGYLIWAEFPIKSKGGFMVSPIPL